MRLHQKLTGTRKDQDFSAYCTTELHLIIRLDWATQFANLTSSKPSLSYLDHSSFLKACEMCHFIGISRRILQSTFRWIVIWCAATKSVGWWKTCSFTITLNSGVSSSIHPRLVCRQCYYIMATSALQYLWLMQFTRKKPAPPFKVGWRNVLRRPQVCWPESWGNADRAARRLYEILLLVCARDIH